MIWIVTDHRQTRESLIDLISATGHEVTGVECGDELRKRIQFRIPSLVVIDCGIPDSFEMISSVRDARKSPSIPIIMFSRDDRDARAQALLRGADSYVPKGSLDWAELRAQVARLVGPPPKRH